MGKERETNVLVDNQVEYASWQEMVDDLDLLNQELTLFEYRKPSFDHQSNCRLIHSEISIIPVNGFKEGDILPFIITGNTPEDLDDFKSKNGFNYNHLQILRRIFNQEGTIIIKNVDLSRSQPSAS